jgi:hypothetical protein
VTATLVSLQPFSLVRSEEVLIRAKWHYTHGINVIMCNIVMTFDMIEIDRVGNAFLLIQVLEISKKIRIIHDTLNVAFKVSMIHGIKSD